MKHAFAMQAAAAPSDKNGARLAAIFSEVPADATVTETLAVSTSASDVSQPAASPPESTSPPDWLVHLGYCDHSTNTDTAWLEAAVGHFHCGAQQGADLLLGEGPGLRSARWIKVPLGVAAGGNPGFWSDLRPAHRQWVRAALLRRGAYMA